MLWASGSLLEIFTSWPTRKTRTWVVYWQPCWSKRTGVVGAGPGYGAPSEMYTTTLRMALPGTRRSESETSGFAACICAQAGSFERSRGLGFAAGPLSVTLPLSLVPPGAAMIVTGTQQRSAVAKPTRAGRKARVGNPEIMVLAEVEKRGRARHQWRREDLPCQPRADSILLVRKSADLGIGTGSFNWLLTF